MACEKDGKTESHVTLKVNDRDIELNDFVVSMFTETVLGMLRPLRNIGDVQTVKLEIRCSNSA